MNIFKVLLLTLFLSSTSFAQTVGKQLEYNSAWGVDVKSNLIKNPSAAKNAQFATVSNATVARGTTNKIDNKASWTVDASAQNGYAEFTLISGDADSISGNCEFKGIFLGDGSLYKAQILDGSSNVLAQTVTLTNESNWRAFSVNYPCAAVASRKVRITQTEAGTAPAVSFGKLYYGAATNIGSAVPPNKFSAKVSSSGVLSDIKNGQFFNGTTFAPTDTSLFGILFKGLTAAPNCNVSIVTATATANFVAKIETDATTSGISIRTGSSDTSNSYTKSARGFTIACELTGADFVQPAITANNWAFDWTAYTPTISAASGTLTNFTLSSTQYRLDSEGKLWIRGRLTFTGSPGTWNGPTITVPTQYSLVTGSVLRYPIVMLQDVGTTIYDARAIVNSSSQIRIVGMSGTSLSAADITQAAPFAWVSTDFMDWTVGPLDVVGFTTSQFAPQLLGSITANTNSAIRFESFKQSTADCTASPCVADVVASNTGGIAVTRTGTGQYTATFTPAFGTAPICVVNPSRGGSGHICEMSSTTTVASTSFVCSVSNTSATVVDTRFNLLCFGFR